jgi:hypothetical protein
MKLARSVFLIGGIWGIVVLAPFYLRSANGERQIREHERRRRHGTLPDWCHASDRAAWKGAANTSNNRRASCRRIQLIAATLAHRDCVRDSK